MKRLENIFFEFKFLSIKIDKKYFIFICFYFISFDIFAQNVNVGEEQIDVVKPYLPTLSDAFKISNSPEKDTLSFRIPALKYSIPATRVSLNVEVVPVKAVKIKEEEPLPLSRGLIKAGLGNYNTPMLELFVNSTRSKNTLLSAHLSHISSTNAQLINSGYSDYSKNQISLDGKWFSANKETLEGSVAYNRNAVHYYGFQRSKSLDLNKDSTLHRFNGITVLACLKNNVPKNKEARHEIRLNYNFLNDNLHTSENNLKLDGMIIKNLEKFNIGSKLLINHSSISDNLMKTNGRDVFSLNPFIESEKSDLWKLHAGFRLMSVKDIQSKIRFYPELNASYHLAGNFVIAFAGIDGDVEQNTYQTLSALNPFTEPVLNYLSTLNKLNFTAGIQGIISSNMPYHLKLSYKESDNMPFFVNTWDKYQNKFNVIYTNMTFIDIDASLGYFSHDDYSFQIDGNYFKSLSISDFEKPFHRPDFNLTLSGFYRINTDFTARIHLKASGNQYAWISEDNAIFKSILVKAWLDASIGLDYHFSKKLDFFLNINNIGNQSNYLWYNYPSQKFNLLAGLSYSF